MISPVSAKQREPAAQRLPAIDSEIT